MNFELKFNDFFCKKINMNCEIDADKARLFYYSFFRLLGKDLCSPPQTRLVVGYVWIG